MNIPPQPCANCGHDVMDHDPIYDVELNGCAKCECEVFRPLEVQ